MKIVEHLLTERTLEKFADENSLELHVFERGYKRRAGVKRYYVRFDKVEVIDRGRAISTYGNGDSIKEAIEDYGEQISEKNVAYDPRGTSRRDIKVCRIV